jgi:threonylcarbamoyladenosine tRNA methylthiotransferase MtaB
MRLALALTRFMKPPHKLCRFLHIPVQSGSDRILKRMGRKYSAKEFGTIVRRLVQKVPGIMIGTDVIVGFPGETAGSFEETLRFLTDLPAHYFHVFSYSNRKRARSRTFRGAVSQKVIAERSRILRALSHEKHAEFLRRLLGSTQRVLFERIKDDFWVGHADNYVTIKTTSEQDLGNSFSDVVPVKIDGLSLIGRIQ